MVYRFIILSDEAEDFRRDITIDSEATFLDLHHAILDSVGYKKDQITSFFLCSDEWEKQQEITLIEMDTDSDEDTYIMEATRLSEFLEDERQKLLYVFEYLTERSFFMELREIIPGKNQDKPKVTRSEGKAPEQFTQFEDIIAAPVSTTSELGDDFFDSELNLDEYDEEDFGGLTEGDPFENY